MLRGYSKETIEKIMERLKAELRDPELPGHRRIEVESLLYYLNEGLRYLESQKGGTE